jgi:hypothetical protein
MKRLTFETEKIAAMLRVRFPEMDEARLQETVKVAGEICALLATTREARITARGEQWRPNDAMAEALAFLFNMESMAQADDESVDLLRMLHIVVHSVYCDADHDHAHADTSMSATTAAFGRPGDGGFQN